jgi:mono/diheme cytochrome c family protein
MNLIAHAAACATLLIGVAVSVDAGQKTGSGTAPLVIESMYGPDLYRHYCATCHGRDGTGKGPAAEALKVPAPDLTIIARREKGIFPAAQVKAIVRGGTAVAAHGSSEMPMWGPIFRALDPSDARVTARVDALVSHIASIQQK